MGGLWIDSERRILKDTCFPISEQVFNVKLHSSFFFNAKCIRLVENYIYIFENVFFLKLCEIVWMNSKIHVFYVILWILVFFLLFLRKTRFSQVQEKWTCTNMACTKHMKTGKKTPCKSHDKLIWQNCSSAKTTFLQSKKNLLVFFGLQCNLEKTLRNHMDKCTNIKKHKNTKNCKNGATKCQRYTTFFH